MAFQNLKVSAPGSIMITGEHAVVYGHPSIVCAIDQRVSVAFAARSDTNVRVVSEVCEPTEIDIVEARAEGPLRFVFGAIERFAQDLSHGFDIEIESEIEPTLGLGSSAAVTAAMFAGLDMIARSGENFSSRNNLIELHSSALKLIRDVQRRGSGADLAASIFGGMNSYHLNRSGSVADIKDLPDPPPMSLRYCGYKTPTGEVLAKIANDMIGHEEAYEELYAKMGLSAAQTIEAAEKNDWATFHELIDAYQRLMVQLGVSDDKLNWLINEAKQHPGVQSAKISGSGLGDCIVAFGDCPETHTPVKLSNDGVRIEA